MCNQPALSDNHIFCIFSKPEANKQNHVVTTTALIHTNGVINQERDDTPLQQVPAYLKKASQQVTEKHQVLCEDDQSNEKTSTEGNLSPVAILLSMWFIGYALTVQRALSHYCQQRSVCWPLSASLWILKMTSFGLSSSLSRI